ncbi:putative alpha-amylase 2 [Dendrobium catenatum]|uniref:alpha-amylase n=1 Tax=Dendrobium catenatum TaxID=906689 RepID=A0A2I0VBM9_9ASPA|nr:putative alpha-amylase 2 [Dendrobium catenatum]
MDVRRHQDIHSRSTMRILESHSNLYAAIIGERVCIKIGDRSWCPTDGEWKLATSGTRYAVWCR